MILASVTTIEDAKDYVKRMRLTSDDCRILKGDGYVNVVSKGGCPWELEKRPDLGAPSKFLINMLLKEGHTEEFLRICYPDYEWKDDKL